MGKDELIVLKTHISLEDKYTISLIKLSSESCDSTMFQSFLRTVSSNSRKKSKIKHLETNCGGLPHPPHYTCNED